MLLQHRLACLALVVILSAATVSASAPTGTVTCNEATFAIEIVKAYETGKDQEIDITIGTGKASDGTTDDNDCLYTAGDVSNPNGLTVATGDITGSATKITYGSDTSGADKAAKCGGTLKNSGDGSKIEYKVDVEVIVRTVLRKINRELKYKMPLVCQLTRAVDAKTGTQSWQIDTASLDAMDATMATKSIDFKIEVNFHADNKGAQGAKIADTNAKYIMGSWVHIQVKETTDNALFKFVTKKCWFMASSDKSGTQDIFFKDYCPVETSKTFDGFDDKSKTDPAFNMKTKAFFFTDKKDDTVTVACDLYICLTDDPSDDCTQRPGDAATDATPPGCGMKAKRRRRNALPELLRTRRSVDDKHNRGWIEHRVVKSKQAIMLDRNDVIVPTCGGDFVYDRVTRTCSNENLLEISGLYLDIPWNIEYANSSSQTFKDFASGKAYQLYVLTQIADGGNVIRGLEVVSAKKGSVILTVRIKYSESSNAASAFEVFQRAIERVPARQRATNTLNIRSDKVIEYVEVKRPSPSSGLNVENLTLIIVIVVLCAAVFISVIAVLKVRQGRRGASSNAGSEMKAHDNPNFS